MAFVDSVIRQAREKNRAVVYPEGADARIVQACARVLAEGIAARAVLIGEPESVRKAAESAGVWSELSRAQQSGSLEIVHPATDARTPEYAKTLYELRKEKGMSEAEANTAIQNPLAFGAMITRTREVHAMVAGAANTTADVLRAALTIVRPAAGIKTVSSFFVMEFDTKSGGPERRVIFADCAIIPRPSAEELAFIAYSSAKSCQTVLGETPSVALLSFSTKGSAKHEEAERVAQAAKIVRERYPDIRADGELQFDAAIDPAVGSFKAPGSPVAGTANVFVFPDLAAGNIGYKIAQRIGGAKAYGPFIQGLAYPVSDLSRGCNADDVVATTAVMLCSE